MFRDSRPGPCFVSEVPSLRTRRVSVSEGPDPRRTPSLFEGHETDEVCGEGPDTRGVPLSDLWGGDFPSSRPFSRFLRSLVTGLSCPGRGGGSGSLSLLRPVVCRDPGPTNVVGGRNQRVVRESYAVGPILTCQSQCEGEPRYGGRRRRL